MSTITYVTVVNNAIQEAGIDLASFNVNGTDFTTNTNAMMNRFKVWVATAWRDIQQEAYDWEFMSEQAVVNLSPGVMFYPGDSIVTAFDGLENTSVDILDQDATTAVSQVPFGTVYDLTGTSTESEPFGYFNVVTSGTAPISWALKPGAEYFEVGEITRHFQDALGVGSFVGLHVVEDNTANYDDIFRVYKCLVNGHSHEIGFIANLWNGSVIQLYWNSTEVSDTTLGTDILADDGFQIVDYYDPSIVILSITYSSCGTSDDPLGVPSAGIRESIQAFIHSWKSFNFSEETGIDDFQENIQEINQKSFRFVDFYAGAPSGEIPLQFMSWESFNQQYDLSSTFPGLPRLVTEDNTGRYRFYPHPYYNITLKFDYDRKPQEVSAYNDVFFNLPNDFVNIVMWKALIYYGEYQEQPTVSARANKNYKTMLTRLETKYREKPHFKPHRMY